MKTPCCQSDEIRAPITQSARVDIEENGDLGCVSDFTDPETDDENLFCGNCGGGIEVVVENGKAEIIKKI